MIGRQETLSTVRTRMSEDTTMCTFVTPMPIVGFKAFIAEFALDAFQTCRNSTRQALFAIRRNGLQTEITIYESYDAIFVTKTITQLRQTNDTVTHTISLNEQFTNEAPEKDAFNDKSCSRVSWKSNNELFGFYSVFTSV